MTGGFRRVFFFAGFTGAGAGLVGAVAGRGLIRGSFITPFPQIARSSRYRRVARVSVVSPAEGMRTLAQRPLGRGGRGPGGPCPPGPRCLGPAEPPRAPPAACGPRAGATARRQSGPPRDPGTGERRTGSPRTARGGPQAAVRRGGPGWWSDLQAECLRRARRGPAPHGSCAGADRATAPPGSTLKDRSQKKAWPKAFPRSRFPEPADPPPPITGTRLGAGPPKRDSP